MELNKDVQYIKGVGEARAKILNRLRNLYVRRFNHILSKNLWRQKQSKKTRTSYRWRRSSN